MSTGDRTPLQPTEHIADLRAKLTILPLPKSFDPVQGLRRDRALHGQFLDHAVGTDQTTAQSEGCRPTIAPFLQTIHSRLEPVAAAWFPSDTPRTLRQPLVGKIQRVSHRCQHNSTERPAPVAETIDPQQFPVRFR